MKPIKDLQIVVGILEKEGKILLIQRKDANPMWDRKWEFPGGKIDNSEEPIESIRREIKEETGINSSNELFLGIHVHDWDLEDKILRVHIHCFHCQADSSDVHHEKNKAYQTKWVTPEDALNLDSLEANNDILKKFLCE